MVLLPMGIRDSKVRKLIVRSVSTLVLITAMLDNTSSCETGVRASVSLDLYFRLSVHCNTSGAFSCSREQPRFFKGMLNPHFRITSLETVRRRILPSIVARQYICKF